MTPGRWWVGSHAREIVLDPAAFKIGADKTPVEILSNCTVKDGEATSIEVLAPVAVEHRVRLQGRLALGGKAAAGWRLSLSSNLGQQSSSPPAQLDADGRFVTSCAEPGEIVLRFVEDERKGLEGAVVVTQLKPGDNVWELDLAMGRIEGRVTAVQGGEAPQVTWKRTGTDQITVTGRVRYEADGSFALAQVPAGHIRFDSYSVTPSAASVEPKEFELDAGATLRVEL